MTITSSSTVAEIYALTPIAATADDLLAWTELTLPAAAAVVQTTGFYIGLLGYDLTNFFSYCLTADDCDSDYINADYFDGWAIGANLTLDTYTAAN